MRDELAINALFLAAACKVYIDLTCLGCRRLMLEMAERRRKQGGGWVAGQRLPVNWTVVTRALALLL